MDNGRFQRHDGSGQPRATTDRENKLIVRSTVTAPDSSLSTVGRATRTRVSNITIHRRLRDQNLHLDESHFKLCPDDHRRRVRRRPGQRAGPVFPITYHTGPPPGVRF
ncbi:HTH_Tnp_Tc3_2 domain-containing protein [Trichonephila clavipes]|uniref:HTH_Tnp_Tc3_2 domain-containing protein n=1 Tax=Trichonephila clavipes TaxID=2585209 RepID=A0A8X6R9G8_TRICX|nr:HTH_Tnp_Tc3_2 domain-containing protein [Trichonephila clavipes]